MAKPVIAFIILCFSLLNENQFLSNGNKVFFYPEINRACLFGGQDFFFHDKVYLVLRWGFVMFLWTPPYWKLIGSRLSIFPPFVLCWRRRIPLPFPLKTIWLKKILHPPTHVIKKWLVSQPFNSREWFFYPEIDRASLFGGQIFFLSR